MTLLDLRADYRTRTRFADGADTIDEVIQAAERAGLHSVVIADRVDAGSDWVDTYGRSVNRARQRTALRLYCGVAVDILDADGTLDAPIDLAGVEQVTVISRSVPLPGGPTSITQVRRLLAARQLRPHNVVEQLAVGYVNALRHAADRSQAVLGRPFSLLADLGIDEAEIGDSVLAALAEGCRAAGAMVEVNERLACPSQRIATALAAAGVRLVAAADAYRARDIGRWEYARGVAAALPAAARAS